MAGTAGFPVVYQPHAWSFDAFDNRHLRALAKTWERLADNRTDVLAANCDDEIEEGRTLGLRSPGHALGVPVDLAYFHPISVSRRSEYREFIGLGDQRVLLCLARLARQKGQDLLVTGWEDDPLPNTVLLLVGPGDPTPLQALAPTQWGRSIRWVGEQDDVRPWLWASDLLVLPSRYETVAVVVAEAMASGTPVVATSVNGAAMAITDGPLPPGGVVVPLGDIATLLTESRRLLDEPAHRQNLAAAGQTRVNQLFTKEAVVDQLDMAYAAAMSRTH
jgi:glycosyltransferase involved in cell wall biosynthesis